ncbi:DNA cytosine methyltransferase [Cytobacillus firmus]|uniref:DNA cytosine methyltransferase n=1 Tax=Cytobacillus firmus TaxID=1399 RepID=UPI00384C495E
MLKLKSKYSEVIDLFSGCGGLGLGFLQAGFSISTGIEIDDSAQLTASYNLHWKHGKESEHLNLDISKVDTTVFHKYIEANPIVIGGPPCQAYSLAGRAKLRSLGDDRVPTKDKRGHLYQDFLRHALELDANAVVMENVPESTNYDNNNIPEIVCEELNNAGYTVYWTLLNSADFGVPQTRERVFVIAVKKEITTELALPIPTHRPRSSYIRKQRIFKNSRFYRSALEPSDHLPYWVTVKEAISDLPSLFPTPKSPYKLNKLNMVLPYISEPENTFQETMRENVMPKHLVTGHAFRKTIRDFPIFAKMTPGDNYIQAHKIAMVLFEKECNRLNIKANTEDYDQLKRKMVPPYSSEKFLSKWQKLKLDRPSHTLVAHLSVDTYSHIHPWEPRGITVREAARLQSFPDDFIFNCSMGEAFKQIGNAVPPLLAQAIANSIKPYFE